MGAISSVFKYLNKKILEKSSEPRRIEYLRSQGVKIGKDCRVNTFAFSTEPYLIEIGDHVAIAAGTEFITHDGSTWCFDEELGGGVFGKIKIGNNVFIGINCIILLNTTIGNNCIIGAGSVVRGNFPDNSVIFGNPAKVVSNMSIQKLLFRQNPGFLKTNNLSVPESVGMIKKHFGIS